MATLKELAAYTNLSIATISRILNNDPTMVASEDTRRRVLEAAGALGYKKHNKGKVSAVLRFGVAEMLTPAEQLEDPFYLYLKNFVAQECMEQKIDLIPVSYTHLDVYKRQMHLHARSSRSLSCESVRPIITRQLISILSTVEVNQNHCSSFSFT